MSKSINPLFSLDAHGTLADTLTVQKVGSLNIVRSKPKLPYSRTLPQQYHRWLYQDYLELWRNETDAVKATYRTLASRYNSTPIAQYMKEHLPTMKHLLAMWRLDRTVATVGYDSTPNNRHLDLLRPLNNTGPIAGAKLWDGVNDHGYRLDAGLDAPGPFTLLFFGRTDGPKDPAFFHHAYQRRDAAGNASVEWWFTQGATGLASVTLRINRSTPSPQVITTVALDPNVWGDLIFWALVFHTDIMRFWIYQDTKVKINLPTPALVYPGMTHHYFGNVSYQGPAAWNGLIDHMEYWDIALPRDLLMQKRQRRFP